MSSRSSLFVMTVLAGAAACASTAMAQKGERPRNPTLQVCTDITRIEPLRIAPAVRMPDGSFKVTGPFQPYVRDGTDLPTQSIFDCYEGDSAGAPTGFCTSGCTQGANCPAAPANSRWYYGPAWRNPVCTNDMVIDPAYNGLTATATNFVWFWNSANTCTIGIFTAEDFTDCATPPGSAGEFPAGIVLDFGPVTVGGHYTNVDLTPNSLFLNMPVNGSGAYTMVMANGVDANGDLILETGAGSQPMLWGCGNDETPPDGRIGTQTNLMWMDANSSGVLETGECYNAAAGANQCPANFGACLQFLGEPVAPPATCYPNCDSSTTNPFLNVLDFNCFLNRFTQGASYANCDNSTTPPILNVLDFNCFLNRFTQGCSAP